MKYIDLHCDTLTAACGRGLNLSDCRLQTNAKKLNESSCAAQCFAVFTDGANAAPQFEKYLNYYKNRIKLCNLLPVLSLKNLKQAMEENITGAILTVENLGFISCADDVAKLYAAGVRMASLVWNYENGLAYPNIVYKDGTPQPALRERRGLKPLGREVIKALDECGVIVDISHLSDGGAEEILNGRKIPVVASHSCAAQIKNVPRNLTDGLIKKIADCGGVVGVNFHKEFLGGNPFEKILENVKHVISVGGEDCVAFGSDFDGIPPYEEIPDCTAMPQLIEYLSSNGIKFRVLEKLCRKNFIRLFGDVCG